MVNPSPMLAQGINVRMYNHTQSSVKRLKSFLTTYILVLAVDELDFDPLAAENQYELEKNTNVLKR